MLDDFCGTGTMTRYDVRERIIEALEEPFSDEEAFAYKRQKWAEKNAAAMEQAGMGGEDDPFLAKPVDHAGIKAAREAQARGEYAPEPPPPPPPPPMTMPPDDGASPSGGWPAHLIPQDPLIPEGQP